MCPRDLAVSLYFLSFCFSFSTAANAAVVLLPEMLLCAQWRVIVMSNNSFLPHKNHRQLCLGVACFEIELSVLYGNGGLLPATCCSSCPGNGCD